MQVKGHMTNKILFKVSLMENFRRKWNLERITVTKILKCFQTNWCRKRRKKFKMEKFFVLAEYFEQQTDCNRYKRKINSSRRSPLWREISRIYISLSNKLKPCHGAINSRSRNFKNGTEKVLSISLKLQTIGVEARNSMPNCEIYFPVFSETIHTNLKIFHSAILGSVGRGYWKKIGC